MRRFHATAAVLVALTSGCAAPSVRVSAEIPATVLLRLTGVVPDESDAALPPVRFEYEKAWYDGNVAVNFRRTGTGTVEAEIVSVLDSEDARLARISDAQAIESTGQDLLRLLGLLVRAQGAGLVPLLSTPAPAPATPSAADAATPTTQGAADGK